MERKAILSPERQKKLKTKFIQQILDNFDDVLEFAAQSGNISLNDPAMTKDDVKQEILLYMLLYNYPKARKLSTIEGTWIPYVKGSAKNCIVNMIQKQKSKKRQHIRVSTDVILEDQMALEGSDPADIVTVKEKFQKTLSGLLPTERDILNILTLGISHTTDKSQLSISEIANHLGLKYSIISSNIRSLERKVREPEPI